MLYRFFALCELHAVGDEEAVMKLAARALAHASVDDPQGSAELLKQLRKAAAHDAISTLQARDPPCALASTGLRLLQRCWKELRKAGAGDAVITLTGRAADAGMFDLFLEVRREEASRYPFGREPDGSPSQTWNWPEPTS
jgi:hypothetical protein